MALGDYSRLVSTSNHPTVNPIRTNTMSTRACDAKEVLNWIGNGTLMQCGARNFVSLGDGVQFDVSRGGRKVIIKLAADDTFTVERVRLVRRTFVCTSEQFVEGIFADQLHHVVAEIGDV